VVTDTASACLAERVTPVTAACDADTQQTLRRDSSYPAVSTTVGSGASTDWLLVK
jgi:hypothetical protein